MQVIVSREEFQSNILFILHTFFVHFTYAERHYFGNLLPIFDEQCYDEAKQFIATHLLETLDTDQHLHR